MNLPILVCGFNRPENISKLLNILETQEIQKVYIHLDGISEGNPLFLQEVKKTQEICNEFLQRNASWSTFIEKDNLKLRKSMQSAMDWFFENEEFGLIFEDDCIPIAEFFTYATWAMQFVSKGDVATFSGTRFTPWKSKVATLSIHNYVWGWGTSREIWQGSLKSPFEIDFNFVERNLLRLGIRNSKTIDFWRRIHIAQKFSLDPNLMEISGYSRKAFPQAFIESTNESWDYTFVLSLLSGHNSDGGLWSLRPPTNLVRNIGFGGNATHFKGESNSLERPTRSSNELKFKNKFSRTSEFYESVLVFGLAQESFRKKFTVADSMIKRIL
jgi:hypothetical protein